MFNKKKIAISLSFFALLTSCGEKPASGSSSLNAQSSRPSQSSPVSLADIFANYRANLTAEGTTKIFYGSSVHSASSFITKFTANSYHFEERGTETEDTTVDFFKWIHDGIGYVATTNIDENNQVVTTPVRDEEGSYVAWTTVQNPFLDNATDPGFFDYDENEGYYYLDFSKDAETRGNRYQAASDLASKFAVRSPLGFESVKIMVTESAITEIQIVTKSFSISSPKTNVHYEMNFTLDNDQSHDHSATMAAPYPHLDYHAQLQAAFDHLLKSPSYSFVRDSSSLSTVSMAHLNGYVSSDVFYYADPAHADNFAALIRKDGKVYEVVKDGDDYAYDETPLTDSNNTLLTSIPVGYYPQRAEPVEAFVYSETSHKYVLQGNDNNGTALADYFAFYFDSFGYLLDEDNMQQLSFEKVEAELDSQNRISSIALYTSDQESILYTFSYDTSLLPFSLDSLKAKDIASDAYGTYQGTFASDAALHANETFTIHFERKENADKYTQEKQPYVYQVTLTYENDGTLYAALNVNYSKENGLSFASGGEDFSLTKQADGTYLLTIKNDEGKTATCVMTKTK